MAGILTCESMCADILQFCKGAIENELQTCTCHGEQKGINILKRNKDLHKGDFLAIIQSWKCNKSKSSPVKNDRAAGRQDTHDIDRGDNVAFFSDRESDVENEKKCIQSLTFECLSPFKASVCDLTKENDILIKLDRPMICQSVISTINRSGDQYGTNRVLELPDGKPQACVNVAELMENAEWPGFSVSHLRSMLLSDHVASLLHAAGYNVDFMQCHIKPSWKEVITEFNILTDKYTTGIVLNGSLETTKLEIHRILRKSRHLEKSEKCFQSAEDNNSRSGCCNEGSNPAGTLDMDSDDGPEPTVMNLRSFLTDQNAVGGFDKNVNLADFSLGSDRLQDLAHLECHVRLMNKSYDAVIHVAPQEKSFYQQTLDLGWQILTAETGTKLNQVHLIHGPVISRGGQLPVYRAEDLLRLRKKQMMSASVLKYGDMVEGPGWDSTVHALTVAGIKFEMLSTTCRQPVKLDVSDVCEEGGATMDSRGGVFVMYNCARLSTLFSNYTKAVQAGVYPSLPPVHTLDFKHLREEEEWALVFNYLVPYPSLVQECVASVRSQTPRHQIHSHKVSQFLLDLSHDLSSYYSRVHILGEPRTHLYPVMFCRLHLLKALQQVMHNALQLLCIDPVSKL